MKEFNLNLFEAFDDLDELYKVATEKDDIIDGTYIDKKGNLRNHIRISHKEMNETHCSFLLDSWYNIRSGRAAEYEKAVIKQMNEIREYFISGEGKVLIKFLDIDKVYSLATTSLQKSELNNMFELIIKSKYDRNENDAQATWQNRLVNYFYKTYLIECGILEALNVLGRSHGIKFEFNQADKYHDYLYSGWGEDAPDLNSPFGKIEIKSEEAKDGNKHEADFLIVYNKTNYTATFELINPDHKIDSKYESIINVLLTNGIKFSVNMTKINSLNSLLTSSSIKK